MGIKMNKGRSKRKIGSKSGSKSGSSCIIRSWSSKMMEKEKEKENCLPSIQEDIAVIPSVLGETLVTLLKMLMRTRKRVTRRAILPGTTWQTVVLNRGSGYVIPNPCTATKANTCPSYVLTCLGRHRQSSARLHFYLQTVNQQIKSK